MEFLLSHIQLIRSLANVDPKKRRKNSEIDNFSQLYFKQLFSADRLWSFQGIHKIRILRIGVVVSCQKLDLAVAPPGDLKRSLYALHARLKWPIRPPLRLTFAIFPP